MKDTLYKVWNLFSHSEKRKAAWALMLVMLMAVMELVGVLSIMPFLSVLAGPQVIHENPWLSRVYQYVAFDSERQFVISLGLLSIVLVVGSSLFKAITQHALNRFMHMQRHSLSVRLLEKYLHQPYAFFIARNSSELSKNILSEVDLLVSNVIVPVAQVVAQGAIVLVVVVFILVYDASMAISIFLVLGCIYGLIYSLVRSRLARMGGESRLANRKRYQACQEVLSGIKDIKVTHSVDTYLSRFSHYARSFSRYQAANDTISQTPLYVVEAVGYSGLIVIAIVLMLKSNDLSQVLPALGLYGFAAYRVLPAAQVIYRGMARLRFTTASLERLHQDFSLLSPVGSPLRPPLRPEKDIVLEHIDFAYPGNPQRLVVENLDLVIPVNTSLAIVGKSGAGKSTLMDIVLGLLAPQRGCMRVDGVEITAENVREWQLAIGYVPQHIYLADASVAENIALGVARESIDMRAVERAAKCAQLHEFVIDELAQGYDTPIGERGIMLSGGQRQRVGIARALYRDPPVLLFDEATSALDVETEAAIGEAIEGMMGKKTVIVIAHREGALRGCDRVMSLS